MCVPYTYLIGWSDLNLWYYGAQYSMKSDPKNLWKTYFTSSKIVPNIVKDFGEPDIVEVRKVFTDQLKAKVWEERVLKKLKLHEIHWLNQKFGAEFKGIVPTLEIGRKISASNKGHSVSEETRKKIGDGNRGHITSVEQKQQISEVHKGKIISEKMRNQISNKLKGHVTSEETRKKIGDSHRGKFLSEEHKQKLKDAHKRRKIAKEGELHDFVS